MGIKRRTKAESILELVLFALSSIPITIPVPFHLLLFLRHLLRNHIREIFSSGTRNTGVSARMSIVFPPQLLLRHVLQITSIDGDIDSISLALEVRDVEQHIFKRDESRHLCSAFIT